MKNILIISVILFGALLTSHTAQASNHQRTKFDRHLDTAYNYPSQLNAAINWRLNHINLDLGHSTKIISKFGWHPSIIAVISSPKFGNYVHNRPHSRRYNKHSYSKNSYGYKTQNRNSWKQKRSFNQKKRQFSKQNRRY